MAKQGWNEQKLDSRLLRLGNLAKDLLTKVASGDNLKGAFKLVKKNKGAAGVDRISIKEVERNLNILIEKIGNDLITGRYQPLPIQAATCKSEEFNGFLDWVTFGGDATIQDNDRNNQRKIIKYVHLVANMVSLHVMANMTIVVNEMRNEGIKITDEILNKHSPFRTDHINRLGIFSLSGTRKDVPLEYSLTKIRP